MFIYCWDQHEIHIKQMLRTEEKRKERVEILFVKVCLTYAFVNERHSWFFDKKNIYIVFWCYSYIFIQILNMFPCVLKLMVQCCIGITRDFIEHFYSHMSTETNPQYKTILLTYSSNIWNILFLDRRNPILCCSGPQT